jgi:hypothetical protein
MAETLAKAALKNDEKQSYSPDLILIYNLIQ